MQWNFYKHFIPLTDKIEAGVDLVRTITSIEEDWRRENGDISGR